MSLKEIELMVCGADEIDVDDWEKYTQYENGYTKDSQAVVWFWAAVRSMSHPLRAALLSFATGSSQVPSGGFRFLQPDLFTIQRVLLHTDVLRLTHAPTRSTFRSTAQQRNLPIGFTLLLPKQAMLLGAVEVQ